MWISIISWYLFITLVGAISLPIAYRFLGNLPDRGVTLARPLGLLVWGFVFWLLASLQLLQNNYGGMLLALLITAGFSYWALRKITWQSLRDSLKAQKRTLLISEVLFAVLFVGWAIVRATYPDIAGTEKPMEMAFINAILHSPTLPPNDPWLSGYSISYYYFGYVMVAMLTRMTGVLSASAFNLASALWFAMTGAAAYGLLANLLMTKKTQDPASSPIATSWFAPLWALLAPLFLLLVSNIEGLLEILHARGIFWQQQPDGTWFSGFWRWIDLQELVNPPAQPFTWVPQRPAGIWWWRASRVLQDYDLAGQSKEIIDEFPFFSYLLADLHPHVLAMPFALLVVGLALNMYLKTSEQLAGGGGVWSVLSHWLQGEAVQIKDLRLFTQLKTLDFWMAALALGGLAFMNTWDFPIYVALYSAVIVLNYYQYEGWSSTRVGEFIETGIALGISGIILYIPFYLGFASQAGGILPSMVFFTRGIHFWIMFAPLLLPIFIWLAWKWKSEGNESALRNGLKFALIAVAGLWVFSFLLGWFASSLALWGNLILSTQNDNSGLGGFGGKMVSLGGLFATLQGTYNPMDLVWEALKKRFLMPGTWLTLSALVILVWGLLSQTRVQLYEDEKTPAQIGKKDVDGFLLLLILVGSGLTLVPEFIYLRDQFGWRMNTIFKFYFQTWILWGLAASYAFVVVWSSLRSSWKHISRVVLFLLLCAALVYPYFGLRMRFRQVGSQGFSLDGSSYLGLYSPDELDAIKILGQLPPGIVAEAIGGSYSGYARVSTFSGYPTVLGWPGHESQWRGGSNEMGTRQTDIERLYQTPNWTEALSILDQYHIRYVYVGGLERNAYRVNEVKFQNFLKRVYGNNSVSIYEYTGKPAQ